MSQKNVKIGLNEIAAVDSVSDLLTYDGEAFIYACYRTLLCRFPDQTGLKNYLQRLNDGVYKWEVISEIRLSAEGQKQKVNIKGMDSLLELYKVKIKAKSLVKMISKNNKKIPRTRSELIKALNPYQIFSKNDNLASSVASNIQKAPMSTVVASGRTSSSRTELRSKPVFWFDLTTSMEWTGGVVGIVRAELEIAWGLKKIDPEVRFSMQKGNGFVEIQDQELDWLFNASNVTDAYMRFFDRYRSDNASEISSAKSIKIDLPDHRALHHPYGRGDVIVSVGWMDSQKESYFSKVKTSFPHIFLVYLVYDTILLHPDTRHLYPQADQDRFEKYIKWISETADFVLFGGKNAKQDTHALQVAMKWPSPPGEAVKFGSDIIKVSDSLLDEEILKEIGIVGSFIITVGSIEPRKNHDTLYRAYLMALAEHPDKTPQLIICGRLFGDAADLVDSLDRDPRLVGKVLRLSPTDSQLAVLYKYCRFTVLPSLYEGWSLTLPESLSQHKFCLATDTPPLREIGGNLIDYAPGWDARTWADKILHYANDDAALEKFESRIKSEWQVTSWKDTACAIHQHVKQFVKSSVPTRPQPEIWMDLTLTFLQWQGGVSGIIRAELTFARYLHELAPNTHFFAYDRGHIFEINQDMLIWLFNDSDLSVTYQNFQDFWRQHEENGAGYRSPFNATEGVHDEDPSILHAFPDNSILFFAGIDWGQDSLRETMRASQKGNLILTSQLIYDMTPMLVPHLHRPETCHGYGNFVEFVSQNFDHIVYGGQTAQRDAILIQKTEGWCSPDSDFIEFGSDINSPSETSIVNDHAVLDRLGVGHDFIITVGTIQPRKNQETLYKAYVTLYKRGVRNLPKLVFIGKEGWKFQDFLKVLQADERMKDLIQIISPTDDELDVLYRYCRFTLLPSFYEGWSLTLPESLSYGKFCLTSNADPLRETGRDLVEYIDPLDTFAWANRIAYYVDNPDEVLKWESRIRNEWKPRSWKQSTKMLLEILYKAHARKVLIEDCVLVDKQTILKV